MRRAYAIRDIILELQNNTASNVDIRTEGGDFDIDPPEIILSWRAPRLPYYGGANTHGGFTTDQSGNQDGNKYHQYFNMTVECLVRSQDELERENLTNTIMDTFAPYEYDSTEFDDDTAEWSVGNVEPRNNPVVEPDWYENAVMLNFVLLRETTDTAATLETIQQPDPDNVIDITLEDGEVSVGN